MRSSAGTRRWPGCASDCVPVACACCSISFPTTPASIIPGWKITLSSPKGTQRVREREPDFCFMAEIYWNLEWTLQQQGFDYTYDKRLHDRLREGEAPNSSQCYVRLSFTDLGHRHWQLHDLIGGVTYDREGNDLQARGLYLDERPWNCHAFTMTEVGDQTR